MLPPSPPAFSLSQHQALHIRWPKYWSFFKERMCILSLPFSWVPRSRVNFSSFIPRIFFYQVYFAGFLLNNFEKLSNVIHIYDWKLKDTEKPRKDFPFGCLRYSDNIILVVILLASPGQGTRSHVLQLIKTQHSQILINNFFKVLCNHSLLLHPERYSLLFKFWWVYTD